MMAIVEGGLCMKRIGKVIYLLLWDVQGQLLYILYVMVLDVGIHRQWKWIILILFYVFPHWFSFHYLISNLVLIIMFAVTIEK